MKNIYLVLPMGTETFFKGKVKYFKTLDKANICVQTALAISMQKRSLYCHHIEKRYPFFMALSDKDIKSMYPDMCCIIYRIILNGDLSLRRLLKVPHI